jgi:RNA recognition motif-containing protein
MPNGKRRRRPSVEELHGHANCWEDPTFSFLLPLGAAEWRVRFDPQAGPLAGQLLFPGQRPLADTGFPLNAARQYSVNGWYTASCNVAASAAGTSTPAPVAWKAPGDPRVLPKSEPRNLRSLRLLPLYPSCPNDARDERTLLVLNVNNSATEAYITAQFGRYGQVEQVVIHRDDQSRPMGFVSIRMKTREACHQAARNMHQKMLMGMRIQALVDPHGEAAAARRRAFIEKRLQWETQQHEQSRARKVENISPELGISSSRKPTSTLAAHTGHAMVASEQSREASTPGYHVSRTTSEGSRSLVHRDSRSSTLPKETKQRPGTIHGINDGTANPPAHPVPRDQGHDRARPGLVDSDSKNTSAQETSLFDSPSSSSTPYTERNPSVTRQPATGVWDRNQEGLGAVQVTGVPQMTPESVLRSAFCRFGRIIRIRQETNSEPRVTSGRQTVFNSSPTETLTFRIYFGSREQAKEAALRMDQHMLMGKRVRVACIDHAMQTAGLYVTGAHNAYPSTDVPETEHQRPLERVEMLERSLKADNKRLMPLNITPGAAEARLAAPRVNGAHPGEVRAREAPGSAELADELVPTTGSAPPALMHAVRLTTLPLNTKHYELSEALVSAPCRTRCLAQVPFWYVLLSNAADLYRFMRWLQHRHLELLGCVIVCEACQVRLDESGTNIQQVALMRKERTFSSRLELLDAIGDTLEGQLRNAILRDLHREILDQVAQQTMETFESQMRDKLAKQRLDSKNDSRNRMQVSVPQPLFDADELGTWPRLRRARHPGSEIEKSSDVVAKQQVAKTDDKESMLVTAAVATPTALEVGISTADLSGDVLDVAEDHEYLRLALELYVAASQGRTQTLNLSTEIESQLIQIDIRSIYDECWSPWLSNLIEQYWTACERMLEIPEPPENATGCARCEGHAPFSRQMKPFRWRPPKQVIVPADEARRWSATGSLRGTRVEHRQLLSAVSDKEQTLLYLQSRERLLRFFRSGIHGYGLWALEDIPAGEYIIEYRGELVRSAVADLRERAYRQQGMGDSFMFRIDADTVVDATHIGSVARFVNHCCDPNATARIIQLGGSPHILFYSKRAISVGEEITYDYHFDVEEDATEKIPCLCGAVNCRQYLN